MPGRWPKRKVKETRIVLEKFNRCFSTSNLRNPLFFDCYQRQNITIEYFKLSRPPSMAVLIFEMFTQLMSKGSYFEEVT